MKAPGRCLHGTCWGLCAVCGDVYDEYRRENPENYPWKVHFGPWRAGYMDITINEFVMRYGMHDIEEEVKKTPKKYTDMPKYKQDEYLGTKVEF